MTNRVDYLSDQLVHLRGKLKPVSEVVPPDSIVNGVSVRPAAASNAERKMSAENRRREDTVNLTTDFRQRLVKRTAQLDMQRKNLQQDLELLEKMQQELANLRNQLDTLQIQDNETLSPVELGERFRSIDQAKLRFFELEGTMEMLLRGNAVKAESSENVRAEAEESFGQLVKKGWALALTVGSVVGLSVILAALIILHAWR